MAARSVTAMNIERDRLDALVGNLTRTMPSGVDNRFRVQAAMALSSLLGEDATPVTGVAWSGLDSSEEALARQGDVLVHVKSGEFGLVATRYSKSAICSIGASDFDEQRGFSGLEWSVTSWSVTFNGGNVINLAASNSGHAEHLSDFVRTLFDH